MNPTPTTLAIYRIRRLNSAPLETEPARVVHSPFSASSGTEQSNPLQGKPPNLNDLANIDRVYPR